MSKLLKSVLVASHVSLAGQVSLAGIAGLAGVSLMATPAQAQVPADLPMKESVRQSAPLPIDGVWRVSTINKRIRIEGGRAYMIDPWVQAFFFQVKRDMVTLRDMQRLGPGAYIAQDLPMQGSVQMKLAPDGNIDANVRGVMGAAKYRLIRESVDDPTAFQNELSGTDFSGGGDGGGNDFDGVSRRPNQTLETWHVYIHKAWCTGRKTEVAFVKEVKASVSVKAYTPGNANRPATTRNKSLTLKCKANFDKKTYRYDEGDKGLLVLTGTREQIASYKLDYGINFHFKPGKKARSHTKSFNRPGALKSGLPVGERQSHKYYAGVKARPDIHMDISFKRIR